MNQRLTSLRTTFVVTLVCLFGVQGTLYAWPTILDRFVPIAARTTQANVTEVHDEESGRTRYVRTVTVYPDTLRGRIAAFGAALVPSIFAAGASFRSTHRFIEVFDTEAEALAFGNLNRYRAMLPLTPESFRALHDGQEIIIERVAQFNVGVGPFLHIGHVLTAGSAGASRVVRGNFRIFLRRGAGNLMSVSLVSVRGTSDRLGANLGGEHDGPGLEQGEHGLTLGGLVPGEFGAGVEREELSSSLVAWDVDLGSVEGQSFLQQLITPNDAALTMGSLTESPIIDISRFLDETPDRGVVFNGRVSARSRLELAKLSILFLFRNAWKESFERIWINATDQITDAPTGSNQTISLVLDRQRTLNLRNFLLGRLLARTSDRGARIIYYADQNGQTGDMVELHFGSTYRSTRRDPNLAFQLRRRFDDILGGEAFNELFGPGGSLIDTASEFEVHFDLALKPSIVARIRGGLAIRGESNLASLHEDTIRTLLYRYIRLAQEAQIIGRLRASEVERTVHSLFLCFDQGTPSVARSKAFHELRKINFFKQIAVPFLLSQIPRSEWSQYLTLKADARYVVDGTPKTTEVVLGITDPDAWSEHRIKELIEASEGRTALGSSIDACQVLYTGG